eukprot:2839543-Pleurochrysis_carterae.AAC.5
MVPKLSSNSNKHADPTCFESVSVPPLAVATATTAAASHRFSKPEQGIARHDKPHHPGTISSMKLAAGSAQMTFRFDDSARAARQPTPATRRTTLPASAPPLCVFSPTDLS